MMIRQREARSRFLQRIRDAEDRNKGVCFSEICPTNQRQVANSMEACCLQKRFRYTAGCTRTDPSDSLRMWFITEHFEWSCCKAEAYTGLRLLMKGHIYEARQHSTMSRQCLFLFLVSYPYSSEQAKKRVAVPLESINADHAHSHRPRAPWRCTPRDLRPSCEHSRQSANRS